MNPPFRRVERLSPEELRARLFQAVKAGEPERLAELCRVHLQAVLEQFPGWKQVPPEIREDPARVREYAEGLIRVAQTFAETLGRPELLQGLAGAPESNPLVQWEGALREAAARAEGGRHAEAAALLESFLPSVEGLKGTGVEEYLPVTYGRLGEYCFRSGARARGLRATARALALCEGQGDAEGVVAYLGNLYEMNRACGMLEAAAEYAGRLAEVLAREGRPGEQAVWLNNLAELRRATGDLPAAEPLYRQALEILEGLPEKRPPDQAVFLNNLAELYRERGDYPAAAPLYREALELQRAATGEDDPGFATTLNNQALLFLSTGDLTAAESLLLRSFEIRRASLGEEHLQVAQSLNNLGALRQAQGRCSEAEPLLRQALEIKRRVLGDYHPEVAVALRNLAALEERMRGGS
jgi:tetratricopeptide (TPR) repeat protein